MPALGLESARLFGCSRGPGLIALCRARARFRASLQFLHGLAPPFELSAELGGRGSALVARLFALQLRDASREPRSGSLSILFLCGRHPFLLLELRHALGQRLRLAD